MKKVLLLPILLFALALPAFAQQQITASVTVTNATTNGMSFTLNGDARTFTNNVLNSATQVLTNSDATGCGSKTNLLSQIYANRFPQVVPVSTGTNSFNLVGNANVAMSLSVSAGYASVSYSTQTVSSVIGLTGPIASLPTAQARTNVASDIVGAIGAVENTNQIPQTSVAATQLMGTTNTQTITGQKALSNPANSFNGTVTNSPSLSGNIKWITGGVISNATVIWGPPGTTNAIIDASGNAVFTTGIAVKATTGDYWEMGDVLGTGGWQLESITPSFGGPHYNVMYVTTNLFEVLSSSVLFSTLSTISNLVAGTYLTVGLNSSIGGNESIASNLTVSGSAAIVGSESIGGNASVAGNFGVGGSISNMTTIGPANFPAGADIAFGRKSISSLANGGNAGVAVGTNEFIALSGPSAAFSINGMTGGRDGKLITLVNQTGFQLTIANESGVEPVAANRIRTLGSATDLVLTNCAVTLQYDASVSRWIVLNHNP